MSANRYAFLPFARQALYNLGETASNNPRKVLPIRVNLDVNNVASPSAFAVKQVELQGPGDISGFSEELVIRTEPKQDDMAYEPSLLASIEFYDEDLPWRYSPDIPGTEGQLKPWLFLLVLAEGEYTFTEGMQDQLPRLKVDNAAIFPDKDEIWAWAHVHVNADLLPGEEVFTLDPFNPAPTQNYPNSTFGLSASENYLNSVLPKDPDKAFSRILSPRRLRPNTNYRAFLIPSYETGRRSGIGEAITGINADLSAWDEGTTAAPTPVTEKEFPVYFNWTFKTGKDENFQYLARQLRPRDITGEIGGLPVDISQPGFGLTYPVDQGVINIPGILKPIKSIPLTFGSRNPVQVQAFQQDLIHVLNYSKDNVTIDDEGFPVTNNNPYSPAASGSATRSANYYGNSTQGAPISYGYFDATVDPVIVPPIYGRWHAGTSRVSEDLADVKKDWLHELNLNPTYRIYAGIGSQVVRDNQDKYVRQCFEQLGDVLMVNRNIVLMQHSVASTTEMRYHHLPYINLQQGGNQARVRPVLDEQELHDFGLHLFAPLFGRIKTDEGRTVLSTFKGSAVSSSLLGPAFRRLTRPTGKFMRNMLTDFTPDFSNIITQVLKGLLGAQPYPALSTEFDDPEIVVFANLEGVESSLATVLNNLNHYGVEPLPGFENYDEEVYINTDELATAVASVPLYFTATPAPEKPRLDLSAIKKSIIYGTQPEVVFLKRSQQLARLVAKSQDTIDPNQSSRGYIPASAASQELTIDSLLPIMEAPVLKEPMYEAFRNLSKELFLPGVEKIKQNTVSLLEVHQEAIEAYMVGLNYEMGLELLWRGFPTDLRGTVFRQFWDPKDNLANVIPELKRDIKPINEWGNNKLGKNQLYGSQLADDQLVMIIRGDLLKKYPNAVIYAQPGKWVGDKREPDPAAAIKLPIYRAELGADIVAVRFSLTALEALGSADSAINNPGWFFCIQERPGEVRFGLDMENQNPDFKKWKDYHWGLVTDQFNMSIDISLTQAGGNYLDYFPQLTNGAEVAYAAFYQPAKVAIHAQEMITIPDTSQGEDPEL